MEEQFPKIDTPFNFLVIKKSELIFIWPYEVPSEILLDAGQQDGNTRPQPCGRA